MTSKWDRAAGRPIIRYAGVSLLLVLTVPAQAQADGGGLLIIEGLIALDVQQADPGTAWSRSGLGRYLSDDAGIGGVQAHLGLDWQPSPNWTWTAQVRADNRGEARALQRIGVVAATVSRHWYFRDEARLTLQVGQDFLPTSLEAVDRLWQSRYTLSLSSLNSWIAEEIRPIGIDGHWRSAPDQVHGVEVGGRVFAGNDSAGSLLAWRGFAMHDRLSVLGESLPLPPLPSLADPAQFGEQRDIGTRPFGPDLDGRPGYALHGRVIREERWKLLASWFDNRGDRRLHRGEYAWDTRFRLLGAHWQVTPSWELAAESLRGKTGMGSTDAPAFVDVDFRSTYLLSSWSPNEAWRLSLRWERFAILDRDHSVAEDNSDRGRALAVAGIWTPGAHWRLGLEYLAADTSHAAADLLSQARETAGDSVRVEARYRF